jgi:hypothetical protein
MPDRIGYRLIRPPGWLRLNIDDASGEEVHGFARYVASASPPESRPQFEALIRKQLGDAMRMARDSGGQDLYLPTQLVDGLALPMTIVVAVSPPAPAGSGPGGALLAFASRHDGAEAKEVGGSLAVRAVQETAAKPGSQEPTELFGSRRVTYLVDAPGGRLMFMTWSMRWRPCSTRSSTRFVSRKSRWTREPRADRSPRRVDRDSGTLAERAFRDGLRVGE